MKEIELFQLSQNEEKLIELLQRFNYPYIDAKILTYLLGKKTVRAKQMERDIDLRQPEVSTGIKRLRNQGFIYKTDIPTQGKGRPIHEYHLKMKPDAIKVHIIKYADEQIAKKVSQLEEIKSILKDVIKS